MSIAVSQSKAQTIELKLGQRAPFGGMLVPPIQMKMMDERFNECDIMEKKFDQRVSEPIQESNRMTWFLVGGLVGVVSGVLLVSRLNIKNAGAGLHFVF